jgi:hypothetical protein
MIYESAHAWAQQWSEMVVIDVNANNKNGREKRKFNLSILALMKASKFTHFLLQNFG